MAIEPLGKLLVPRFDGSWLPIAPLAVVLSIRVVEDQGEAVAANVLDSEEAASVIG
jgi:hypothetical protein